MAPPFSTASCAPAHSTKSHLCRTSLMCSESSPTNGHKNAGSNLNVVSGRIHGIDVSAGANSASGLRSRLARAGPRSGPAQSETRRSERSRWETSVSSTKLALRERKRKTPIVTSDRGRVWRRPPAGDATTSKWGLASHEPAVVVQSRLGQAWPVPSIYSSGASLLILRMSRN